MSLSKLSTKLSSKIAECLLGDTPALSAFSMVSKYYCRVVEPYLYRHIIVKERDKYPAICFLFTLMARRTLASHILSFRLVPTPQRSNLSPKQEQKMVTGLW
jgi:hypothetical protein